MVVDAPSGRLETVATMEGDRAVSVRFQNVPAYVHASGVSVLTSTGSVTCDIAFGGTFYASVRATDVRCEVAPRDLPRLIELGREIKHLVEAGAPLVHPVTPELRDVYGVTFFDELGTANGRLHQRNVTIFADGEVDRSPCGSGTSARLAILDASGQLARGATLVHDSIIGTTFLARVVGHASVAGRPAVVTEVEGSASITGHHRFVLEPHDELGTGFLLR